MTRTEAFGAISLFAFLGALLMFLVPGCAHVQTAKDVCTGPQTRQEAAKLVVPHLAWALMCAANTATDEEQIACVTREFEALRSEAKPIVYACAIALVGDAVAAVQK